MNPRAAEVLDRPTVDGRTLRRTYKKYHCSIREGTG
jgi:hypothetical protein